jgi:hypothetical protein
MDIEFEGKKGTGRLLIISYDIIGKHMAGPGIRFYGFKVLSIILMLWCSKN